MDGMHDTEDRCSNCSLKRAEWRGNHGRGYAMDGVRFCCQACAEEVGCTCFAPDPEAVGGGETWDHHRIRHSE